MSQTLALVEEVLPKAEYVDRLWVLVIDFCQKVDRGSHLRNILLFPSLAHLETLSHIHGMEASSPSQVSHRTAGHLWNLVVRDLSRYSAEHLDCLVVHNLVSVLYLEEKMLDVLCMVPVHPNDLALDHLQIAAEALYHPSYLCILDQALDLDPGYRPASPLDLCRVPGRFYSRRLGMRQNRVENLLDSMRADLLEHLEILLGLLVDL